MGRKTNRLEGRKFGRLTVIQFSSIQGSGRHAYWDCRCRCGALKVIRGSRLVAGNTRSCGCLSRENARRLLTKYARSDAHKGEGNPRWKGDEAKHSSVHTWLNKYFRKDRCEECGSRKNLDWALVVGKTHSHDRGRYMVLCRKHHVKYDYKNGTRKRI